jgi:thymidylate synthase
MKYNNATEALVLLASKILREGDEVQSRNGMTKEITDNLITIDNPTQRCYILPHRNDSIFAKIAETMWVLSGRNDVAWLSKYLPRAIDYSDDGKTWRAGYGQRLRNWEFTRGSFTYVVDQLQECYTVLTDDPTSRRAVASIFDPVHDYWLDGSQSMMRAKDVPCNDWLHFYIRNGALNLNIAQRSSDLMWGFSGINTFEFSVIQEAMASWLNVKVGELNYFISSLHLYEKHWERAQKMVQGFSFQSIYDEGGFQPVPITTSYDAFHDSLKLVMTSEMHSWWGDYSIIPDGVIPDPFLKACAHMLRIYALIDNTKESTDIQDTLGALLTALPHDSDFLMAAIEYIERCQKGCVLGTKLG